ncbi:MAG: maleylpyruvate isomerase N-terminal domain-containing protein [Anaerolineales bacterium]
MNIENKNYLLKRLSDTHVSLQETLEGVELEQIIYKDTGWRIRDILGHIATWDRVLIHAIQTYLNGSEYVIPGMVGDETDYNAEKVEEQRKLPTSEILQEWNRAREDFKDAVRQVPTDRFFDELAFPWGDEHGSFTLMIEYMIEHNGEHQEEILEASMKTG